MIQNKITEVEQDNINLWEEFRIRNPEISRIDKYEEVFMQACRIKDYNARKSKEREKEMLEDLEFIANEYRKLRVTRDYRESDRLVNEIKTKYGIK